MKQTDVLKILIKSTTNNTSNYNNKWKNILKRQLVILICVQAGGEGFAGLDNHWTHVYN